LNFEAASKRNKELQDLYIQLAAGEKSLNEVKAMWPFPVDT
jgi:hypothetical protein